MGARGLVLRAWQTVISANRARCTQSLAGVVARSWTRWDLAVSYWNMLVWVVGVEGTYRPIGAHAFGAVTHRADRWSVGYFYRFQNAVAVAGLSSCGA